MDDREKTMLDLKRLEERDRSDASPSKKGTAPGVPPDGVDIEGPAQHKPAVSVEDYLKSLAEGKETPEGQKPGGSTHETGGHVHFRVAPPKSNAPGHFP